MTDNYAITDADLFNHDTVDDYEAFESYDAYQFESQVQTVAERIQQVHQDRQVPFAFGFSWSGALEGGVDFGLVEVYTGDLVYLMRALELKHLTDNRDATGLNQARAIRDALMSAHADLIRFTTKHGVQKENHPLNTWTFVGHWEDDRIVVEYVVPGDVADPREDTGFWEQGLFASSGTGATEEEALAEVRAEYESQYNEDEED